MTQAQTMLELADYLDFLEQELIGADADLKLPKNLISPGIWADRIRATTATAQPVAQDGWKLVPVEPTKEMIQASIWALDRWREKHGNVQGHVSPGEKYQIRWRAMLAAAPATPSPLPAPGERGPHSGPTQVRAALGPFAKIADDYEAAHRRRLISDPDARPLADQMRVSIAIGDCRKARAALSALPPDRKSADDK